MFARFKPNTESFTFPEKKRLPGLSVIICCYNSAPVIVPTVRALSAQTLPADTQAEIILIDNNCTDDTAGLARAEYSGQWPLKIIREERPGLMYARIAGIRAAAFDLLQFADDDNILEPGYLYKCVSRFRSEPAVTIIGGLNIAHPGDALPAWFGSMQHVYACGPRAKEGGMITKERRGHFFGAGLAFRAQAIEQAIAGPPPPFTVGRTRTSKAAGDDLEIVRRIFFAGGNFYYDPEMVLNHNIAWSQDRLNWKYIRQVTKGGGLASIPLAMYADLQHRGRIDSYIRAIAKTVYRFTKLVWHHKHHPWVLCMGVNDIRRHRVFYLSRLWALLAGRLVYNQIRRKILESYPSAK